MFLRENNKRSYLAAVIDASAVQMELQTIDYDGGAKDRNISKDVAETMQLVLWGIQYPNPGADPNREIVEAVYSGSGDIYNIVRAQGGTIASSHYINDNVALLWTTDMSWEVCIFKEMLEDLVGTIGSTQDNDANGEMEVVPIQPDDETFADKYGNIYNKVLATAGPGALPLWRFSWDVGGDTPPV